MMARQKCTSGVLCHVLAESLGLAPFDVKYVLGRAQSSGHVSKGTRRGLGGSPMEPSDAANLIIAVLGARSAKDADVAVATFRSLVTHQGETFGSALEDLIRCGHDMSILVEFEQTQPAAQIHIGGKVHHFRPATAAPINHDRSVTVAITDTTITAVHRAILGAPRAPVDHTTEDR